MSSGVRSSVSECPSHYRNSFLPPPLLVCSPLPRAPDSQSYPLDSTRAGTVRHLSHLSHFLRWTAAQRFSVSNTRFRSFRPTSLISFNSFSSRPPIDPPPPPPLPSHRQKYDGSVRWQLDTSAAARYMSSKRSLVEEHTNFSAREDHLCP
jgi:hypothetical protein